jgi:hypothetical protein
MKCPLAVDWRRTPGGSACAARIRSFHDHGVTGTLVRPFLARLTVLDAYTTFGLALHFEVEVILMAYCPTPPRSDLLLRQVFPQPFRNDGLVLGLCVS